MARVHGAACVPSLGLRPSPATVRRSALPPWAQSALMLQRTAGNRAVTKLLGAPSHPTAEAPVGVGASAAGSGVPVGRTLLVPELGRSITEKGDSRLPVSRTIGGRGTVALQPVVQRKACNFYVYDSTEGTRLGKSWKWGAALLAAGARGGHAIASSHTIEYMLKRIVDTVADDGCDCVEEMQFWSHGSAGNAMYISKTGDEFTAADFDIPNLDQFGNIPSIIEMARDPQRYQKWKAWFNALTWRQQLLVELRSYICGSGAEIYYRSCSAFQGKAGQEFAKKSAAFWRSKVIGHTKIIGFPSQPGRKELKPGEAPHWPESEGETTEMKKKGSMPKKL